MVLQLLCVLRRCGVSPWRFRLLMLPHYVIVQPRHRGRRRTSRQANTEVVLPGFSTCLETLRADIHRHWLEMLLGHERHPRLRRKLRYLMAA